MPNKKPANVMVLGVAALLSACGGGGGGGAGAGNTAQSELRPVSALTTIGDGGEISLASRDAAGSPASSDFVSFREGYYGFAAFASAQADLVGDDSNGVADVFFKRTSDGGIWRASVPDTGSAQANGASGIVPELPGVTNLSQATVSQRGNYTAFVSNATNLAGIDSNGVPDVYVRFDTGLPFDHVRYQPPRTYRVSITAAGIEPASASFSPVVLADGVVAFVTASALVATDTNSTYDVYVKDLATGNLSLVSRQSSGAAANGASFDPAPCADKSGAGICFLSWADNLVAGDSNGALDLFMRRNNSSEVVRLTRTATGAQADQGLLGSAYAGQVSFPSRLYDVVGNIVGFLSESTNLVPGDSNGGLDAFAHDLYYDKLVRISTNADGSATGAALKGIAVGGYRIAFVSDQPLTGTQTSAGGQEVYVREFYPGNGLYRASNLQTDSWPINSVFQVESFSTDTGNRLFFSGDALALSGPPTRGLFRALLP